MHVYLCVCFAFALFVLMYPGYAVTFSASPTSCNQLMFVEQDKHVYPDVVNESTQVTGGHQTCVVEFVTHPSLLLVLNLTYSPHPINRYHFFFTELDR